MSGARALGREEKGARTGKALYIFVGCLDKALISQGGKQSLLRPLLPQLSHLSRMGTGLFQL